MCTAVFLTCGFLDIVVVDDGLEEDLLKHDQAGGLPNHDSFENGGAAAMGYLGSEPFLGYLIDPEPVPYEAGFFENFD